VLSFGERVEWRGRENSKKVQEILLAIHIKRDTWDKSKPEGPWIISIVSYKLSGMLRARRIRSRFDVTFQGLATDQGGDGDLAENATGPAGNAS
jgi:DNA-directed RNA polymerase specialized sigma24 family protein